MPATTESEERTRSVLDPIHGLIRLTDAEMNVVDHRLFQRLRHIKQNGLLHLVFPAATHTRFEHSLGVLYVAHGMLNSLSLNSKVSGSKGNVRPTSEAQPGEAATFPVSNSPEWNFLYKVARLAALTHDLGHGPLSHTFDSFAPTRSALSAVLEDPALDAIRPLRGFLLKWGTDSTKDPDNVKNHRVPHEVMSCVFFAKIWHDNGGSPDIALAVCAAILGEQQGEGAASLLDDPLARQWVPLIHDVVASAPADADRMDYMERDSRGIGVTYGLFDRNRVLKSLLCYRDHRIPDVRYRLGVKQSGLKAIENLMQARYELFVQVYYHKTNRAVSRMLETIGTIANREMDLFSAAANLDAWIETYLDLSDEQFLRLLLGHKERVTPEPIERLAAGIQERALWKRILDPTTEAEADKILEVLRHEFPAEKDSIRKDDTKPKALKDLDGGAALLVRNGAGIYEAGRIGPWTKESTIIHALAEADKMFVRIYFDSGDESTAKKIRERALELAFRQKEAKNATS